MRKPNIFPCVDYYSLLKKSVQLIVVLTLFNQIHPLVNVPGYFNYWVDLLEKIIVLFLD